MKLFVVASVFALSSILVSGSTIHLDRRGPPTSICGEGSVVLDETSISHGGKTVLVSTSTCPPTKRDTTVSKRSAINIDKRQDICIDGDCSVVCAPTSIVATVGACDNLIDLLAGYAPDSIDVDPGSIKTWADDTCGIAVANGDATVYTICYETIAADALIAVDDCFDETSAAACAGSGMPGDIYAVGVASL